MHELHRQEVGFQVAYNDLREWIAETDKLGELCVAEGYNWEEQIGMASELLQHNENAPAALFDKIPDFREGYRVLVNFFGGKRKKYDTRLPFGP